MKTVPFSSGSVDALIGVACVSVQSLEIVVLLEGLDFFTVVAANAGVTFLMHLHLMNLHFMHLHLMHMHFMHLHLMHLYQAFLLFLQLLVSPVITRFATLN